MYRLRKPTLDGRTELILTPLQFLDRLAYLSPPQGELSFDAGVEVAGGEAWPEIDQAGGGDDGWG